MNIAFPTQIKIGGDALDELSNSVSAKRVLIVTGGDNTKGTNIYKKTILALKNSCKSVTIFDGIRSNPSASSIKSAASRAKAVDAEAIITIGGGSCHDAGKLAAVLAKQDFNIEELTVENAGYSKITDEHLPVYTVPTLLGTGADISPASLVRLDNHKKIVFSPHMYPAAAYVVVDHIKLDQSDTVVLTAFDAFVQSSEAYLSRQSNLWSDMFARSGISNSIDALIRLSQGDTNTETVEQLAISSIQGLMAVSNSSVGAVHALSDPLSGIYDMHHGKALALVMGPVLELNSRFAPERVAEIGQLLSDKLQVAAEFNERGIEWLINHFVGTIAPNWWANRHLELPNDLDFGRMVEDSNNPDMGGNPGYISKPEILTLFEKSCLREDDN